MMEPRLSLADPGNSASLVAAATWVEALVTGTTATIVATIAVASVGFLMLQGRLPLRRGLVVVMGCFVIFGSGALAEGLLAVGQSASTFTSSDTIAPPPRRHHLPLHRNRLFMILTPEHQCQTDSSCNFLTNDTADVYLK
ncbi:TrbC/VirB2 family protein [Sphingomonas aurantiaca]|uniref:TrbC/VirB2 family protein n=1 Tax=Sphingomonas aurantiaca TaxID=185949 RepID=UPI002FE2795F